MITVSPSQIEPWLIGIILPWVRVMGWMMADPIWGHRNINRPFKVVMSAAMTWAILPSLQRPSAPPVEWIAALAHQLLIGIAIGFAVRVIIGAVNLAGQMISTQMGLSFATLYDTHNAQSSPVVGEMLTWIILMLLWSTNSPVAVWMILVESFQWIPLNAPLSANGIPPLIGLGTLVFHWGAILALPLIIQLLFLNLSFGMLNRLAPQLNLLSLSFPATLLAGMIMLWLTQPIWYELTPRWTNTVLESLRVILKGWQPATLSIPPS